MLVCVSAYERLLRILLRGDGLLLLPLLLLQDFALSVGGLNVGLHAFGLLACLVKISALHDSLDDGAGIHLLVLVAADLLVDAHLLGHRIHVFDGRHERGWPVVDSIRSAPRQRGEVALGRREGSTENDGVDVLYPMLACISR